MRIVMLAAALTALSGPVLALDTAALKNKVMPPVNSTEEYAVCSATTLWLGQLAQSSAQTAEDKERAEGVLKIGALWAFMAGKNKGIEMKAYMETYLMKDVADFGALESDTRTFYVQQCLERTEGMVQRFSK
ncbi:hypothetical protein PQU92_03095 [Asticcacaulis sp. BYS171W]|uniref:Valyl-tRNA synthetase n=1 Tax=Asticcacaulis aquaticus TaxID=2984212 RepID=A0ABT5HQ97_9CAUL|nr:hypothetical protein [Asticcacaulis aquaticus]MDC7682245.1 hypothetical protein [Asticcacaulis aquaticus]